MSSRVRTQTRPDLERQDLDHALCLCCGSVGMGRAAQLACSKCTAPGLGTRGANSVE